MTSAVTIRPVTGLGEILSGEGLASNIAEAIRAMQIRLESHSILVVAQKVISKAESRFIDLRDVEPSDRARDIARASDKDPRLVELILRESSDVMRVRPHVLIVRHRLGYVMAHAGIDRSNVPMADGWERVLLLPEQPDESAASLRAALGQELGVEPGVIVSDSFGRAWRLGTVNVALGCAGVAAVRDRRGELDRDGRPLENTIVGWADAIAAAAGLVMGEAAEGHPVVLVEDLHCDAPPLPASALIRPIRDDLFT